MTAPERIFASKSTNGVCVICFSTKSDEYVTQYARADLHDATKVQLAECEARLRKAVEALKSLIQHAYNCEKELTEELHHMDFCGESLLLINARAVLAEIEKGGV